jgi:hypothetical protein
VYQQQEQQQKQQQKQQQRYIANARSHRINAGYAYKQPPAPSRDYHRSLLELTPSNAPVAVHFQPAVP